MKKNITLIIALFIISIFTNSCKKEIKEPPADTRNDNFVYVEIDGEKFMVEDRTWNYNKYTKGVFSNQPIDVSFENDTSIYLSFGCTSKIDERKNKKYRFLRMGMTCYITKKLGISYCKQVSMNAISYTENESIYFDYYLIKEPNSNFSNGNNSYKNCAFIITKFDEEERAIEFFISGKVENERDNSKLVPFKMSIKLKNNSKFL